MATRRRLARAVGVAPKIGGPLDDAELAAYEEDLALLLDALGLEGRARAAARDVSTRRDTAGSARALLAFFEARGAIVAEGGGLDPQANTRPHRLPSELGPRPIHLP